MKRLFVILCLVLSSFAFAQTRITEEPEGFLLASPAQPNGQVFVFYPGGLVPARAYTFMAEALANRGITVAIAQMPFELAILGIYRAQEIREALTRRKVRMTRFVVGGHSLGGAMAGWYAAWLPVDGLIVMGGYSALEIQKEIPTLVIAAQNDGLATLERVKYEMWKLPPTAQLVVIPGGVHAFFGRYGEQRGDGQASVSRDVFEAQLLAALYAFFGVA